FHGNWLNSFWTVWTLNEMDKQIIHVNQLSDTKVYAQRYVNKSITALFINYGIYCLCRKISISYSKISFFIS
ncbi:MAG TPA: hypothetical protein PKX31_04970, partial [Chitinophagaceae bacterium]|nr:hypothetical protein [Chitinophagaceae bacterium]